MWLTHCHHNCRYFLLVLPSSALSRMARSPQVPTPSHWAHLLGPHPWGVWQHEASNDGVWQHEASSGGSLGDYDTDNSESSLPDTQWNLLSFLLPFLQHLVSPAIRLLQNLSLLSILHLTLPSEKEICLSKQGSMSWSHCQPVGFFGYFSLVVWDS